jgi:hypothetical protein
MASDREPFWVLLRMLRLASLTAAIFIFATDALAQTPIHGHYPPGQTGLRGAAAPPVGWSYTNFSRLFSNLDVKDQAGNTAEHVGEARYANISLITWTTAQQIFGMNYGAVMGIPFAGGNLNPGSDDVAQSGFDLGDIVITPVALSAPAPRLITSFNSPSGLLRAGSTPALPTIAALAFGRWSTPSVEFGIREEIAAVGVCPRSRASNRTSSKRRRESLLETTSTSIGESEEVSDWARMPSKWACPDSARGRSASSRAAITRAVIDITASVPKSAWRWRIDGPFDSGPNGNSECETQSKATTSGSSSTTSFSVSGRG